MSQMSVEGTAARKRPDHESIVSILSEGNSCTLATWHILGDAYNRLLLPSYRLSGAVLPAARPEMLAISKQSESDISDIMGIGLSKYRPS